MRDRVLPLLVVLPLVVLAPVKSAPAQGAGVSEKVAALKQSLKENKVRMQRYQWIETTTVSVNGAPKSQKQNRCYYGLDGVVQKVAIGEAPQQQTPRGIRGRIVEKKKEEMTDYMRQAANTVHMYVPPNPDAVESAKSAGNVSLRPLPAGHVAIDIRGYQLPGDLLSVELESAANRIAGIKVSSVVQGTTDPVTLNVQFATLPDGTSYAATSTLNAPAKNIQVVVQNSGFMEASR